ncbi:hypothetical protein P175DRAFT_0438307 [Aspergillus ochraceoroseus IBT 24754]|uniref:C6 transcription factor n=3 Tax=Aspergillus subgen. Nidulantes TaxID=2720870 RepID=A0A0F8VVD8_9EURO|nr:uncharacterized protein P175DRAFT_0438307 [Aspergillus ochraceoroseus IBT 24754]KKK23006.1 hypothetical protein AOCH_000993 [Aspergillus ochraceoroseus]KKK27191.1 hypothetical protein ARAM_006381 [Aspergillus rambellii]PTU20494.1 hypothetical protein P175DRAFT_0438307 [Aspergillus ochraceoroseus IBT 24754]
MVSTRHHPRDFPPPGATKASTPSTPAPSTNGPSKKWNHTPATHIILWLVVSLPLVIWDAGYVLLRPHSMPGGKWHSPIWSPYALYGTVDYIYGWPAYNDRNGFTAAQAVLNLLETASYLYYLWVVYVHGTSATGSGRGSRTTQKGLMWMLTGDKVVAGRIGAVALLVAFSASVMTLSKTALYWLNEAFSDFANIGHNDATTLTFLWIIPNALWLIFPGYNLHILGEEIVSSLSDAGARQRGRPRLS